jgi:hypothetical protein
MSKFKLGLLLLLMICKANGQSIQLTGGSSTLYGANGGAAKIFLPNSTAYVSAGIQGGKFQTGFQDELLWRGYDVKLGDSSFNYSTDGSGLGVNVRGLMIGKKDYGAFVGATGIATLLPMFNTLRPQNFGFGFFYSRRLKRFEWKSLNALSGNKKTITDSVSFSSKIFTTYVNAGLLQNDFQITGTGILNLSHFQLYGNRFEQIFKAQTSISSAVGAGFHISNFSVTGSALKASYAGKESSGVSFGASEKVGWLTGSLTYAKSAKSKILYAGISQTPNRHWSISEQVSSTKQVSGSIAYSGGSYSAQVGRTEVLVPGEGFQSVTSLTVSLKVRDSVVNVANEVLPDGSRKYSVTLSDWIYGKYTGGKKSPSFAKYLITGSVVNRAGKPVVGAAIKVGKTTVYSDPAGNFFSRQKHDRSYDVQVLVAEFLTSGRWKVVRCPASARPGDPLLIIVAVN